MRKLFLLLVLSAIGASNKSTAQESSDPHITVDTDTIRLNAQGNAQSFHVTANVDWVITINDYPNWTPADWITSDPAVADGDTTVTLTAEPNNTTTSRTAILLVTDQNGDAQDTLTITQDAASDHFITVDTDTIRLNSQGNAQSFHVSSNVAWVITIGDYPDWTPANWITSDPSVANGDTTVTLTAEPNNTTTARTAILFITDQNGGAQDTLIITQDAPADHYITITPDTITLNAQGDLQSFEVASDIYWMVLITDYSIGANATWLTAQPLESHANQTVTLTAEPNNTTTSRSAVVLVTAVLYDNLPPIGIIPKDTLFVIQEAAPPIIAPDSITLDRHNVTLIIGDTFRLRVTVLPLDANDRSVTWTSSNSAVATVAENGLITTINPGNATISAATTAGNRADYCHITVTEETIVSQPAPTGTADNASSFDLALTVTNSSAFSGSFFVTFPTGITLDTDNTALAPSLVNSHQLVQSPQNDSTWLFEITPLDYSTPALKAAADNQQRKLVNIAYRTDPTLVVSENPEVKIKELNFNFDDGATLHQNELKVVLTNNSTDNAQIAAGKVYVATHNDLLIVESPNRETVTVYAINGTIHLQAVKEQGYDTFAAKLPNGVFIVTGSSGWTKKLVKY